MEQQKTLVVIVAVVAIVAMFGMVYLKPNAPLQSQTIAGQAYQANNYRICVCYSLSGTDSTRERECPFIKTCGVCCNDIGMSSVQPINWDIMFGK